MAARAENFLGLCSSTTQHYAFVAIEKREREREEKVSRERERCCVVFKKRVTAREERERRGRDAFAPGDSEGLSLSPHYRYSELYTGPQLAGTRFRCFFEVLPLRRCSLTRTLAPQGFTR